MNRPIKFRVWRNDTKEWIHGPGEEVNLFGECILLGGFMPVNLETLNHCIALQYTGLKDKNGKEIYEGDIIKYSQTVTKKTHDNQKSVTDYSNPILGESSLMIYYGEVVFDKINDLDNFYTPTMLAWGLKYGDRITSLCGVLEQFNNSESDGSFVKLFFHQYEIVGNISENPELIKQ